jgi:hypothetical protein
MVMSVGPDGESVSDSMVSVIELSAVTKGRTIRSMLRHSALTRVALCTTLLLASSLPLASGARTDAQPSPDAPPPGYLPPPLNPTGVMLETRRLADGVYALLSNTPFADNAGFVVGAEAVLVVDSHFNG